MTAAERLAALTGSSGSAGALLALLGSGVTASEVLTDYSSLSSGTSSELLLSEGKHKGIQIVFGGSGWNWDDKYQAKPLSFKKVKAKNRFEQEIEIEDEEIIEFLNVFVMWRSAQLSLM